MLSIWDSMVVPAEEDGYAATNNIKASPLMPGYGQAPLSQSTHSAIAIAAYSGASPTFAHLTATILLPFSFLKPNCKRKQNRNEWCWVLLIFIGEEKTWERNRAF
eukprot:TRINITY_DN41215_c1_g1_i2.p1 TRINITY_DN41215_c1_g1~~TRINITY_DN41215_c1_g1_i2.p1  ORF type:complete len:105 (+),score=14.14 TRINITY_DN41215_c1_g1_i2:160-474(+)